MTKDPVCGMEVDPLSAMYTAVHKGETYYFCSQVCKDTFQQNPGAYLKTGGTPRSK